VWIICSSECCNPSFNQTFNHRFHRGYILTAFIDSIWLFQHPGVAFFIVRLKFDYPIFLHKVSTTRQDTGCSLRVGPFYVTAVSARSELCSPETKWPRFSFEPFVMLAIPLEHQQSTPGELGSTQSIGRLSCIWKRWTTWSRSRYLCPENLLILLGNCLFVTRNIIVSTRVASFGIIINILFMVARYNNSGMQPLYFVAVLFPSRSPAQTVRFKPFFLRSTQNAVT
jgi:hypothetical protein